VHASGAAARACAWGGAVLFILSLSFFLFSFDVTFARDVAGPVTVGPVLGDIAIFSIFAVHHSLFARTPLRERIARSAPALERSLYVWVASALLIVVCLVWQPVPGVLWHVDGAVSVVLEALHIAGLVLSVVSAAAIDMWDLAGVRQVYPPSAKHGRADTEFKTTGPYGWVRHPIYLGWFLIVFAVGHMTATRFLFAAVSSVYLLVAIPLEERSLLAATGGAYERYREKVRFKVVPGIY
jgi:methanethiol S-methyltransferase